MVQIQHQALTAEAEAVAGIRANSLQQPRSVQQKQSPSAQSPEQVPLAHMQPLQQGQQQARVLVVQEV